MPELIQKAGEKWLMPRAEKQGFEIAEQGFMVESYDQHRSSKRGNNKPISHSSMDLAGVLRVTDVEPFTDCLLNGIGPAKAFGCGLMLVRRV